MYKGNLMPDYLKEAVPFKSGCSPFCTICYQVIYIEKEMWCPQKSIMQSHQITKANDYFNTYVTIKAKK